MPVDCKPLANHLGSYVLLTHGSQVSLPFSPIQIPHRLCFRCLTPSSSLLNGEWRHWLEEAEQPFLVWPDLKNPEYIHEAKRINSRQARGLRQEMAIRMKMKLPSYPLTALPFWKAICSKPAPFPIPAVK